MLEIKNLTVFTADRKVLDNINLTIKAGERHVIFGPNGSGKSSLVLTIMGIPTFKIKSGEILFNGKNINKLTISQRAKMGIGLGFQNPPELRGVRLKYLLEIFGNAEKNLKRVLLNPNLKDRDINVGFSGGEKKLSELAQLFAMNPRLLILDEPDSGVDMESLKLIGKEIKNFLKNNSALLLITHYGYILKYLNPDKAHVMIRGKIACSGSPDKILNQIMKRGYRWCEKCPKIKNGKK